MTPKKEIPWYLWPFYALWNLVTWILGFAGRVVAAMMGGVLMIVGILVSLSTSRKDLNVAYLLLSKEASCHVQVQKPV